MFELQQIHGGTTDDRPGSYRLGMVELQLKKYHAKVDP
jgi:hypothetical protein